MGSYGIPGMEGARGRDGSKGQKGRRGGTVSMFCYAVDSAHRILVARIGSQYVPANSAHRILGRNDKKCSCYFTKTFQMNPILHLRSTTKVEPVMLVMFFTAINIAPFSFCKGWPGEFGMPGLRGLPGTPVSSLKFSIRLRYGLLSLSVLDPLSPSKK